MLSFDAATEVEQFVSSQNNKITLLGRANVHCARHDVEKAAKSNTYNKQNRTHDRKSNFTSFSRDRQSSYLGGKLDQGTQIYHQSSQPVSQSNYISHSQQQESSAPSGPVSFHQQQKNVYSNSISSYPHQTQPFSQFNPTAAVAAAAAAAAVAQAQQETLRLSNTHATHTQQIFTHSGMTMQQTSPHMDNITRVPEQNVQNVSVSNQTQYNQDQQISTNQSSLQHFDAQGSVMTAAIKAAALASAQHVQNVGLPHTPGTVPLPQSFSVGIQQPRLTGTQPLNSQIHHHPPLIPPARLPSYTGQPSSNDFNSSSNELTKYIFVQNLPTNTEITEIRDYFGMTHNVSIRDVSMEYDPNPKHNWCYAHLELNSVADASKIIHKASNLSGGGLIFKGRNLIVNVDRNPQVWPAVTTTPQYRAYNNNNMRTKEAPMISSSDPRKQILLKSFNNKGKAHGKRDNRGRGGIAKSGRERFRDPRMHRPR